jgi:hypothetical protein
MWRISLLIFLAVALIQPDFGQTCTTQALRTVNQAEETAAAGNLSSAKELLQRAFEECQSSSRVLRKIADLYALLGDSEQAEVYRTQAARLENQTPIILASKPGDQTSDATVEENSFVREKWALIVGISNFKNPAMNLRFAAKDARDFAATLTDPEVGRFSNDPQHVKLLTDDQATVEGIRTAINDIAKSARKEDLVVLYFSSHGTSAANDVATDEGKSGYIVAYNTNPQNLYATAFPMDELKRVVDTRIKAGRVVAFMDTCYSGGFHGPSGGKALEVGIPSESMARIAQGKGRIVIASSRDSEQSWESDQYQNSYFTHYIIEAMKAKKGMVTITQLFTELQRKVPKAVAAEKNASQNPIMSPEGRNINITIGTAVN